MRKKKEMTGQITLDMYRITDYYEAIKQETIVTGKISIGKIMRMFRISSREADQYFQRLLAENIINKKGAIPKKQDWCVK